MKVDIISRELIKPSSPTPSNLKIFKLSYLDQQVPPFYVPLILYYSYNQSSNMTQHNMSYQLKKSLSETLTQYYPLAGRMTEEHTSVDCRDQGVYYSEARVDSCLSDIIECSNIEELNEFIPCKLRGVGQNVVEEQLAIQVNFFLCGGIVIGLCMNHRIADACTFASFIKAWAFMAKGESPLVHPILNSASLFPPVGSLEYRSNPRNTAARPPTENLVSKRFLFTASAIAGLKAKVVDSSNSMIHPTRIEAVTALIWRCGILAQTRCGKSENVKSVAFHVVNLRGRMTPPLEEDSFGNLFQMASAVTDVEPVELASLVGKLRAAFGKVDGEYLRKLLNKNGFEVVKDNFKKIGELLSQEGVEVFRFSSWCRFPIYKADFGWGKPTWVSRASYGGQNCIFFIDARQEGGIEAWVVMDKQDMEKFEQEPELQDSTASSLAADF